MRECLSVRGESLCEAVSTSDVGLQCPLVSDGLFVVLSAVFNRLVGHGNSGNSLVSTSCLYRGAGVTDLDFS